jgi:hypothetical protein
MLVATDDTDEADNSGLVDVPVYVVLKRDYSSILVGHWRIYPKIQNHEKVKL